MAQAISDLRIDLGCGNAKKKGTLGVDIQSLPGVDYVVDLDHNPLPFGDNTVGYVHSSHFLEHVSNPSAIFAEIGRVCRDGARLELWTPYAWSNDAFIFTHKTFFNEAHYLHMCYLYPDFYKSILRGRWILEEIQYVIRPEVLCELAAQKVDLPFALQYMHGVAHEFCVHINVHKMAWPSSSPIRKTFAIGRLAERFELRQNSEPPSRLPNLESALKVYSANGPLPPLS